MAEEPTKKSNPFPAIAALKVRCLTALQSATDVIGATRTQASWRWASGSDALKAMTDAKTEVDDAKASSEFLRSWVVQQDFAKYCKKTFTDAEIEIGLGEVESFKKPLEALETEVARLKRMHQAR